MRPVGSIPSPRSVSSLNESSPIIWIQVTPVSKHEQALWRDMLARSFHPSQWFDRDDVEHTTPESQGGFKMWVYKRSDAGYTVGFYDPNGDWQSDSDHDTKEGAVERVHFLNGGVPGTQDTDVARAAARGFRG